MAKSKSKAELDRDRELYRGTSSGPPSTNRDQSEEHRKLYARIRARHPEWTVREIAVEMGISKSQVHRLQLSDEGRNYDVFHCEVSKPVGKRFRKLAETRGHTLADEIREAVEHWLKSKECRE